MNDEQTAPDATPARTTEAFESDAQALAKVRELLFGDALRSIRDEVMCNHELMVRRFAMLENNLCKRVNGLAKRVGGFQQKLENQSRNHDDAIAQLDQFIAKTDQKLDSEVKQLRCETEAAGSSMRNELDAGLARQEQLLRETEEKLVAQLRQHVEKLTDQRVDRYDFADNLRRLAAQVSTSANGPH